MNLKSFALAIVAAIAAFLVVGGTVTALAEPRIEFSVFLGIPAGLIAAVIVFIAVYLGLADDASHKRYRVAFAVGLFGVGFIAVLVVGAVVGLGVVVSMLVGIVAGVLAGIGGYLWGPTRRLAAPV